MRHKTSFRYSDAAGKRQQASVRIDCAYGLSPFDEFYLWGLLALTLAQRDSAGELEATPHYCLRQLGVIEPHSKGGRSYLLFRQALERLSGVRYRCDAFYDPIRKEHRRVSFGLLGYSLPLRLDSSRAWRVAWDPQFYELAQETAGRKWFDLERYRRLDPATRRLWLLLSKILWRTETTHPMCVRSLTVDSLGFAASVPLRQLRAKLVRSAEVLVGERLLRPIGPRACQFKSPRGGCFVQFRRGPEMNAPSEMGRIESPLREPLRILGLDESAVSYVLRTFTEPSLRRWTDVTLVALEQKGRGFFRRSAAAFLIDNLQADARSERTPPDWYIDAKKRERQTPVTRPRERASLARIAAPGESGESVVRRLLGRPNASPK